MKFTVNTDMTKQSNQQKDFSYSSTEAFKK